MGIDIRPVTAEQVPALFTTFRRAMGFPPESDAERERSKQTTVLDRSLAAFDGEQIVGSTYSHLFEYTLPGAAQIPVAGVTAVGVLTTHRRQGIISSLLRRQLDEAKQRGEAAAILVASEGVIYGRFGYGVASLLMDYEIVSRDFQVRPPKGTGTVRFIDEAEADKVFPEVHERWRLQQPGAIRREPSWWSSWQDDRKAGVEPLVVYETSDGAEGYARYSISSKWDRGMANNKLNVNELVVTSPDAAAALWRHMFAVDLVRTVGAGARPIDDPLRWLLANPRAMQVTRVGDFLWLRILDVPRVLGARSYAADVDLVLEVDDAVLPEVGGRFALHVSDGRATVEPTTAPADIRLPISELGSIASGAIAASEYARVGRIEELTAGAVAKADAAFASAPKPWGCTWF